MLLPVPILELLAASLLVRLARPSARLSLGEALPQQPHSRRVHDYRRIFHSYVCDREACNSQDNYHWRNYNEHGHYCSM